MPAQWATPLHWAAGEEMCHLSAPGPGSPIWFYAGNEADVTTYVNATGLMWEHAAAHGALLVFAEHRFYGETAPCDPHFDGGASGGGGGGDDGVDLACLALLTHEQVSSSSSSCESPHLLVVRLTYEEGSSPLRRCVTSVAQTSQSPRPNDDEVHPGPSPHPTPSPPPHRRSPFATTTHPGPSRSPFLPTAALLARRRWPTTCRSSTRSRPRAAPKRAPSSRSAEATAGCSPHGSASSMLPRDTVEMTWRMRIGHLDRSDVTAAHTAYVPRDNTVEMTWRMRSGRLDHSDGTGRHCHTPLLVGALATRASLPHTAPCGRLGR